MIPVLFHVQSVSVVGCL